MMRQGRIIVSLLLLGVLAPVSAVEYTLIDFTTFNDNIAQVVQKDQELYNQVISENPAADIRNDGWPDFTFEPSDWNIDNWVVTLNSSSQTVKNKDKSTTKNAPSKKYGNVLGVRLKFNPWENAFWGTVSFPYFLSPTYLDGKFITADDNNKDNGLAVGLLVNVGQIRNVKSWINGLNYNNTYGIRVVNEFEQMFEFGMGSTFFEGWRRLTWQNDNYIIDPKEWNPIKTPLYPLSIPYIKFDSLAFYKSAGNTEANFIGYVKDVTVDYDFAMVQEERDIDDEAVWHIIADRAIAERIQTSKRIAEELTLKNSLVKRKQQNEDAAANNNQQNNNDQNAAQ